jgi:hypothetical protein
VAVQRTTIYDHPPKGVVMNCKWPCCKNEVKDFGKRGKVFCSKNCCLKFYVTQNRKKYKQRAVALLGGRCFICGYCKCIRALQFHHLRDKSFGISETGCTRSWVEIEAELQKCILLCANCHAEQHAVGECLNLVQGATVTRVITGSSPVSPATFEDN